MKIPAQVLLQVVLLATCLLGFTVQAQESVEPDPIKWKIKAQPASSSDAKLITVELDATIERGWHLYSTEKIDGGPAPTRITVVADQSFELAGEIDSPAPRSAYDPNFQVTTEFYEGEVAFTIPVKSTASPPAKNIRVQVRYQTCTPTICLPPKLIELEATLPDARSKAVQVSPAVDKTAVTKPGLTASATVDFDFVDFTGKQRRFSEFRGRVVLLDFWASWCSPCLADIPQLKAAYQKYYNQGFEIIGLDSETLGQKDADADFARDAQAKAREIVSTRGVTWTEATAATSVPVAEQIFAIDNLPAKFLIDKEGKVIRRIKSVAELDEILPKLLSPQP